MPDPIYICRGAHAEELSKIIEVTQSAFGIERAQTIAKTLQYRIQNWEDNRVVVKVQDNHEEIVGSNPIFSYPFHYGPNSILSSCMKYFAIASTEKGTGLGHTLFDDTTKYLIDKGYELNFIYTEQPDYYRSRGYENCRMHYEFLIPLEKIRFKPMIQNIEVRAFNKKDISAISRIYEKYNRQWPLARIRDEAYWKLSYFHNTEDFEKNIICFWQNNQLLGYIWTHADKDVLDLSEFAIDTEIPTKLQDKVEDLIFDELILLASTFGKSNVQTNLSPSYPLVQHFLNYGARDLTSSWTGLMVKILNLDSLIPKWIQYQQKVVIPNLSQSVLESLEPFEFGCKIEKHVILFKFDGKNVQIIVNPKKPSKDIIPIPLSKFAMLVFGNYNPVELVDQNYWDCPDEYISRLCLFFPHLNGTIYPLDRF